MNEPLANIKHEAEHTRQHARFKIPASLLVDGKRYPMSDWSVSGFSADSVPIKLGRQPFFKAEIEFDFEVFKLTSVIEVEVIRHSPEQGSIACRFSNLNKNTLSLFHYIINAYLVGDVVTAGDLIHIVGRENFTKEDLDKRLEDHRSLWARFSSSLTRLFGQLILFAIFLSLVAFLSYTAYKRFFIVEAGTGRVSAPMLIVRAPGDGVFSSETPLEKGLLEKDALLGMVKFSSGGAMLIESPCACRLVEIHTHSGGFVGKGEPLFSLLPPGARFQVEADLKQSEVKQVSIGQRAQVQFPDNQTFTGRVVDLRAPKAGFVQAVIETTEPLPQNKLNKVAQVRIFKLNPAER